MGSAQEIALSLLFLIASTSAQDCQSARLTATDVLETVQIYNNEYALEDDHITYEISTSPPSNSFDQISDSIRILLSNQSSCPETCTVTLNRYIDTFQGNQSTTLFFDTEHSFYLPSHYEKDNKTTFVCVSTNGSCGATVPVYRYYKISNGGVFHAYSFDQDVIYDGYNQEFLPICYAWELPTATVASRPTCGTLNFDIPPEALSNLNIYDNQLAGIERDHYYTTLPSTDSSLVTYNQTGVLGKVLTSSKSTACSCLVKLLQQFDNQTGYFHRLDHKLIAMGQESNRPYEEYEETGETVYCAKRLGDCGATLPLWKQFQFYDVDTMYTTDSTPIPMSYMYPQTPLCYIWPASYAPNASRIVTGTMAPAAPPVPTMAATFGDTGQTGVTLPGVTESTPSTLTTGATLPMGMTQSTPVTGATGSTDTMQPMGSTGMTPLTPVTGGTGVTLSTLMTQPTPFTPGTGATGAPGQPFTGVTMPVGSSGMTPPTPVTGGTGPTETTGVTMPLGSTWMTTPTPVTGGTGGTMGPMGSTGVTQASPVTGATGFTMPTGISQSTPAIGGTMGSTGMTLTTLVAGSTVVTPMTEATGAFLSAGSTAMTPSTQGTGATGVTMSTPGTMATGTTPMTPTVSVWGTNTPAVTPASPTTIRLADPGAVTPGLILPVTTPGSLVTNDPVMDTEAPFDLPTAETFTLSNFWLTTPSSAPSIVPSTPTISPAPLPTTGSSGGPDVTTPAPPVMVTGPLIFIIPTVIPSTMPTTPEPPTISSTFTPAATQASPATPTPQHVAQSAPTNSIIGGSLDSFTNPPIIAALISSSAASPPAVQSDIPHAVLTTVDPLTSTTGSTRSTEDPGIIWKAGDWISSTWHSVFGGSDKVQNVASPVSMNTFTTTPQPMGGLVGSFINSTGNFYNDTKAFIGNTINGVTNSNGSFIENKLDSTGDFLSNAWNSLTSNNSTGGGNGTWISGALNSTGRFLTNTWNLLGNCNGTAGNFVNNTQTWIGGAVDSTGDFLSNTWNSLSSNNTSGNSTWIAGALNSTGGFLTNAWNTIGSNNGTSGNIVNNTQTWIGGAVDSTGDFLSNAWNSLKSENSSSGAFVNNTQTWIGGQVDSTGDFLSNAWNSLKSDNNSTNSTQTWIGGALNSTGQFFSNAWNETKEHSGNIIDSSKTWISDKLDGDSATGSPISDPTVIPLAALPPLSPVGGVASVILPVVRSATEEPSKVEWNGGLISGPLSG
ncbi:Hyphal_reg_CWP domain-containing protein [Caenorhabditis elegans]|uniref:Hyphal_reg_CWP domain-containing protein n=1 Tax=Caenorhabditis elegans TaxID=6239 RepID=F0IWT5_CAEEL|nr:Hyphal_reg_CWP domain-containing protein [Caenorhabditis elegans]CCD70013.1 Hyphal_reg_CWP domain-containing protein [Caenorhabditis elegans]|eukprot:NP_491147.4 Uncharacterized protein CELE_W05F2.7 [Caenorhabditis elegans]